MISFLKYILILFFVFSFESFSFSQNKTENEHLEVRFLKDNIEITPGKSFFNILLLENKSDKELTINIQYNTPKDWLVIGASHEQITLQPLENASLPVRVAVVKNAKGGIGYAVVAIITDLKGSILNSVYSFIKVPVKSKVEISAKRTSYYLDHKNLSSSFFLEMKNLGNIEEAVNVELIPDKSLNINGFSETSRILEDYHIGTNETKKIKYSIKLKKEIDLDKFKVFKVKAIIKTNDSIIYKTAWFKYLNWEYNNSKSKVNKPLSIDLDVFNILSNAPPTYRGKVYGTVLLKKHKDIFYSFENINRDNTSDLWVNSRLQLKFNSKRTSIFLGDYQGNIGQSMYGRGVEISQKIAKHDYFSLVATQRLLSKINNFGGMYSHSFKKPLTIEFGGAYTDNIKYNRISYLGYTNFSTNIFKKHSFNLFFANSKSIRNTNNTEYKYNGWAYRFAYSSRFNNIKTNFKSYYSSPSYSGTNNGRFYLQARALYDLSKTKKIILSHTTRMYSPVYYIDNVLYNDKFINSNDVFIRYNILLKNNLVIYTGPIFSQQATNNFRNLDPNNQFATNTGRFELGLKLSEVYSTNSISFSAKYGITNVYDYTNELNGLSVSTNINELTYPVVELSSNFKRKNFNVYFKYFYGPYNINQQFAYFYSFFYSKSLVVIPSYERFIYKKYLKLIIRASYISNLAYKSNRVNINSGIYWAARNNLNIRFTNTTSYQKVADASSSNFSQSTSYFEFGISKSFNIQQPRLKMYNYEAVYYKDLNGNRVHDANEPGVPNVLSDIQRNNPIADTENPDYNGEFLTNELLSNSSGDISYIAMPEGDYIMKYTPQDVNIGTFETESVERVFSVNSDTVMYIPFVEKNKLFGKITLNRTKHSALGIIPIDNIKVTVEGDAKTYSALTDKDGYFELFIPSSDYYKVKINNIFYEHFNLRQDYYIVKFNGYKQFEVSFDFDEKERKIAFDESDFLITDEDLANKDFSFDDIKVIKQTNLKGEIKDANSLVPLHAIVSIHNINTNQLISETASSKRTGVYFTSFFAGEDYNIKAFSKGYWVYKENLSINQITTFENITHDILLNKISLDEEIKTNNLIFESESSKLSPLAKAELDNILATLSLNPTIHIDIIGHTDNLEALILNASELSKTRASSVAAYLVKNGLRESRVKIRGVGDTDPKSTEDSNSGREKNRFVEIRVSAF